MAEVSENICIIRTCTDALDMMNWSREFNVIPGRKSPDATDGMLSVRDLRLDCNASGASLSCFSHMKLGNGVLEVKKGSRPFYCTTTVVPIEAAAPGGLHSNAWATMSAPDADKDKVDGPASISVRDFAISRKPQAKKKTVTLWYMYTTKVFFLWKTQRAAQQRNPRFFENCTSCGSKLREARRRQTTRGLMI